MKRYWLALGIIWMATGCTTEEALFEANDEDGDGYSDLAGDCDDQNPAINPGQEEVCNGLDDDCDDVVDNRDWDGDTYVDHDCTSGTDCNDLAPSIYPGATEICNGVDDDCDGLIDTADGDLDESSLASYYRDVDGDGFGANEVPPAVLCEQSGFYSASEGGDCDDLSASVNPDAEEVCNDVDDNCDYQIDEGLIGTYYQDADGDGYGDGTVSEDACALPTGFVENSEDCDDTRGEVHPGLAEICGDSLDNNCDEIGCDFPEAIDLGDADAKLIGAAAGDQAGYRVSSAGDVNNDGFDDILVGAVGEDTAGTDAGAIYLFEGPIEGEVILSEAVAIFYGESAGDEAGGVLAAAGDVDGDGHGDVLFGVPNHGDGGAAYLFLGPLEGSYSLADAAARLDGLEVGAQVGAAVAGAGDLNGDGHADFLVGAPGDAEGGVDAGVVYVFEGPVTGVLSAGEAAARLIGETAGDLAGSALSTAGDVDNDGNLDVLVGAPGRDSYGTDAGSVYLIQGPITGAIDLSRADAQITGESSDDQLGWVVSGGGDFDRDGYDDLLLGAPNAGALADDTPAEGIAYFIYGVPDESMKVDASDAQISGDNSGDRAGTAAAVLGDINGDGYADVAIGIPSDSDGLGTDAGQVVLMFGPPATVATSDSDVIISSEAVGDQMGWSVSSAGDVNGDGYEDVLIGAPFHDAGGDEAGAAYLILGIGY